MELGELLVQLRREKGIYQKELASYLKVSIGTISNYEHGIHSPDPDTLKKLADYFDVSTDYLLQRTTYHYSLDFLNKQIANGYTAGDIMNTILELGPRNCNSLVDFMELLILRDRQDKEETVVKELDQPSWLDDTEEYDTEPIYQE